ncbi:MAG: Ig-like domain-containing protein, partial [Oscillospiraceae bacterium]|nr:Ig-like domain-containing protein [Oscillospiraceae bacterium]
EGYTLTVNGTLITVDSGKLVVGNLVKGPKAVIPGNANIEYLNCKHSWGSGVITTEPTCTESGEKTFTCSKCKNTRTEPVPPSHKAKQITIPAVPATDTETGYKAIPIKQCSLCGTYVKSNSEAYTEEELQAYFNGYIAYAKTTGITLSINSLPIENGITQTVELSESAALRLKADVMPVAASAELTWKSSSTAIATVDQEGNVSFIKPGSVTITATAKDNSKKTASIKFNVLYKGLDATEKFSAVLSETSYLYGQNTKIGLQEGDRVQLNIYGTDKTQPLDPALFTYASSNTNIAGIDENGVITADKSGGSFTIMAVFTGDTLGRKVSITAKTIPVQISGIEIQTFDLSQENFKGVDANGNICSEDNPNTPVSYAFFFEKTSSAQSFRINPIASSADGNVIDEPKGKFTWTSSNSAIAAVRENADGTATVTIKANADGACTITATSKDLSKAQGTLALYVADYSPRLGASNITLDSAKGSSVTVPLVSSYDNKIVNTEEIAIRYEGSDSISVAYDEHAEELTISAGAFIANKTIKGKLIVPTDHGEYSFALNITVKNTLPSITAKQLQKFNLFYLDSTAQMTVTVKNAAVEDVKIDNEHFFGTWDKEEELLTIAYRGDVDFPAKPNTKLMLLVKAEGYTNYIEKAVTLSTVTTKPGLSLSETSGTFNIGLFGESQMFVPIMNKTDKVFLDLSSEEYSVSISPEIADVSIEKTDIGLGAIKVKANEATNGFKGGNITLNLKHKNWLSAVPLTFNMKLSSAAPTLKLQSSTITLNALYPNLTTSVSYSLSHTNSNTARIDDSLPLEPVKQNTDADLMTVYIDSESGTVNAYINDIDNPPRTGSYAYSFVPQFIVDGSDETQPLAKVTVTVKVVNSIPTAKLDKTNVSLNVNLPSQTTEVQLIPTDRNLPADMEGVRYSFGNDITPINGVGLDVDENEPTLARVYIDPVNPPKTGSYKITITPECTVVKNEESITNSLKPITLTVKVTNTRPSAKLSRTTVALNNCIPSLVEQTVLLSTDGNYRLVGADIAIKSTGAAAVQAEKIAVEYINGAISVYIKNNGDLPKVGSYVYTITPLSEYGPDTVEMKALSLTVKVSSVQPTARLSNTSLSLNRYTPAMTSDVQLFAVEEQYSILGADVSIKSTGSAAVQAEKITVQYVNGDIMAYFNDSSDLPKAGNYSYTISPYCQYLTDTVDMKPLTLTVKVVNTQPVAKLSATSISLNNLFHSIEGRVQLTSA